jgi:FkbM family methyltransferase
MYRRLKKRLKDFPPALAAHRLVRRADWWLRDIRSAFFSRSTELHTTPYGFKLRGTNSIHHLAMQKGTFEPEETTQFIEAFRHAEVFVDVGANIGFYSCLARRSALHVVAVEPLAKNLEYLYANFGANNWKDVEVFPVGVSDSPGFAALYGGSSTGASLIGGWAGASRKLRRLIPLSTLDILLGDRFTGKRLVIKVDVEGAEYPVLLGAAGVMDARPKPIWMVEICLNEYHPDGINPHFLDTFNLLWQRGYEAHTADQRNKLIQRADVERWLKCGRCDSGVINYKFVPLT